MFLEKYRKGQLIQLLGSYLSESYGGEINVSIDNFYPLRATSNESIPGCDAVLYPPVIWFTRKGDRET